MTTTIDTEQALMRLYRARQTPQLIEVPELSFLMIDGQGDPNVSVVSQFQSASRTISSRVQT